MADSSPGPARPPLPTDVHVLRSLYATANQQARTWETAAAGFIAPYEELMEAFWLRDTVLKGFFDLQAATSDVPQVRRQLMALVQSPDMIMQRSSGNEQLDRWPVRGGPWDFRCEQLARRLPHPFETFGIEDEIRDWIGGMWLSVTESMAQSRNNPRPEVEEGTLVVSQSGMVSILLNTARSFARQVRDAISVGERTSSNPNSQPKRLSKCEEAAYQSYQVAVGRIGVETEPTDQQAFDWLKEHGPPDYELPDSFHTWQKYVRTGRRYYGTQKRGKRGGQSSRSAIRLDQID